MINCTFENGNKALLRHATVDTIVTQKDKILLVKRTTSLNEAGKWCIPGGYIDRDEHIVDAAKREVLEETGWTIEEPMLIAIVDDPKRAKEDRQNITFLFTANAVTKAGNPDWESDEQQWFPLESIPHADTIAFDHAKLIATYKQYIEEKFQIPKLGY